MTAGIREFFEQYRAALSVPNWLRMLGLGTLVLCVSGTFVGIFYGVFPEMWKLGQSGNWSWWQYALAVPNPVFREHSWP